MDKTVKEVIIVWIILLVSFNSYIYLKPGITGYFTYSEESGYTDAVNLVVSSDYEWVWELENYGELKSLRLSGRIEDSGSAKVYVENNGEKYLIFDSSGLDEILGGITGLAVLNEPNKTIINEPIEPIINETINETTNISESLENLSINKEIKISLKYHEDSEYDADNNGIETLTGVVDLDVNDSIIGNNIDQTKLCTRWEVNSLDSEEIAAVCYGSEQCCNLVSLVPARKSWNEIFYSYYGQYGAGFDNIISAQIIYADYNLSMDEPYSDIGYSEWDNLSVKFIEENVIEFKDACVESCILEGFNSTSYKLIFEINGTILYLDSIRYTVIKERSTNTPPRPLNNFSDITLIKNNNYTIDLSRYFSDEDGDVLSYDAYETENLSVVIEDSIAAIIPDNGFTGDRYMFFKANDSLLTTVSNVFKVNVTGFKEREETINKTRVVINKPVKWVKKVKLDSIKNNVVINITPFAENITVKKIEDGIKEEIKENKIKIKENGEIKELKDYEKEKINNNLITGNVIGITGFAVEEAVDNSTEIIIEDSVEEVEIEYYTAGPVSEEKKINERKKQIVISSDIHYDNILAYSFLEAEADVDAVKLYWLVNGSRQEVNIDKYDTNENSLVDYIEWNVPSLSSQTYELVIEITKAEHLDSNRGFIDDIYDYVQEQDDNWALVNDGEYVRVTFEVPLDNTRDITLYARSNSSSSVEVYTENSDELITTFEDVSSEKLYQVYLTSLTGSYDTFDLKVNGAVEFDYIVDPKIGTSGNISFVDPTPADGSSQSETYVGVNVSINITSTADLEELVYNWNGTNYTYYNDSLVLMMNFDNVSALGEQTSGINNKTVDVSKYENNGTLYGGAGPTWNATGKYGGSFDFDGIDDYVSVPVADNSNLDISGDEITQTAWIYPVADVAFGTIATRNRGYYFQRHSDGKLGAYQYGTSPEGYHYSTGTAPLNQWSFVAYTYNGTYLTFYINGDISGGVAKTGNITQTEAGLDDPFRVGWDGASGARYFNGTIDEVRIWNISLSSDEIYQQYVSNLNKYDTDKWILYVNQSKNATDGLDDGAYTYQAYASDTAGNWNNTERRTITIDTTPPAINFTSPTPTDGASHPYNSVYINVTSSDANNHSVFLDWNKTLIGWWSFENVLTNGTVYDNSSYGNSAIMYNFTSNTTVDGKRGKAVELTRSLNTEIQLSNLNVDTAAGAQNTVEFWMYWEGSDSEMPFGWNTNYDLWARSGATECFGFNTGESNVLGITSSNLSNKWVHVAAVFYNGVPDSTNNELYIDGVKQSISDCAGTTSASKTVTTSAFISGWGSNAGYKFTGKIDEMRIYNRKLSGEEVNASYSANMENYRNNFTSLGERIYTYKSYAIDIEGNVNQTEERTITIDTTYPAINFTSPTPSNGTAQTETYVGVNVSITESSLGSVVYSWNGTNYTYYNDSLVLMFNFDNVSSLGENDSLAVDVSEYGNNGTFQGNLEPAWTTSGKYGEALEFDGLDDHINVSDDNSLDVTTEFTIIAWIKPKKLGSWMGIVSKSPGFRLSVSSTNKINTNIDGYTCGDSGAIQLNDWVHVATTYTTSTNLVKIYINGLEESSTEAHPSVGSVNVGTEPLQIGVYAANFFNGTIDEVRVWNRSLSGDEINQSYMSNLKRYDTDKWELYVNQSKTPSVGLDNGTYTYRAFAEDTSGNENSTEERTITLRDTTPPAISFTSPTPANGASHLYNSVFVNVTSSDANNHSVFLDWNKTLVGWWSFENVLTNGTVYDNSSWSNHGVLNNSPSNSTVSGKYGRALEFDGSSIYVNVIDSGTSSLDVTEITIEAWINPANYNVVSDRGIIINKENVYEIGLQDNTGAFQTAFSPGCWNWQGTGIAPLNSWTHVAVVHNGTHRIHYVNGNLTDTLPCSGSISANDNDLRIGARGADGAASAFFNGSIDEVRIYGRVLSHEEINASYNANVYNYYHNFTGLSEETYTYKAYAIDLEGNVNQTEERTITIDTTYPAINLTSPTPSNGTAQTETYVGVNVSITESSLGSVVYSWNGTNYTYYNDSLVLMFNFDNVSALGESYNISNGTVILDLSKYGNNGTMYGNTSGVGLVYNTTGKYGGAFEFDGVDDYVNVGDDSSLDFTNVLSISAWVKVYSDNSWCIASRWEDEGSSKRSWILFANPDTTTGFRFVTSSDGTWQPSNSIQAGSLSVGEWTQFTAVYNSTHNILYVNGEYAGSVDRSNDGIYDSNRPTYIGYSPDWANKPRFFNGTIDEVRIWNRILSTDEVYQQYASNLNKYDTDKWNFFSNQTNLTDAAYTYQAFAKDTAGNTNQTEERTVTIDATAPAVTIIYPANNSNWNINKLDFNASIDETASWCGISISGNTNQTMTLNSSSTGANYTNSSIVDGSYTFVVSCNDTANNFAQSGTYNFLVDTVFPNITFVNPTLADGSSTGNNWLFVNTSTKDSNNISTFIDFDDSLVSWWRFDDINGSGDPTDYMSRNNGSKVNQAAQTDLGYFGKAFEFDGDGDYVRVTRAIQDDFTVTAWLKSNMACLTAGSRAYHGNGIVWSDSGGDKNDMVPMACFQGKLAFGTGNTLGTYGTLLSTSDINTSKWVFAAITRLKSTGAKALYINGNLENSETSVTNSLNANSVIDIGGNTLDSRYWNGTIDDVMIFNRSLSANEIRNLYSNQTSKYVTNNFTSLSDGSHSFKAYTQDLAGNVNQTEERTVTVDETNPLIDFVNPTSANNSFTRNNYTEINVSITELNLDEFTWNWNKTNYTMYNDSLILMYNFDNISSLGEIYNNSNGSIIKDVSNAGNDGILYVGADNSGNYTTGKYGGAFEFDGVDDYVNISDANSLDFGTSSFTLTVWAKAESLNTYRMIISKGNDERYRIGYWNNNTVYFEVDDDITAKNVYSTRTITDNQWHQLVAVRDDPNNRMQIFIDGNLSGTTNDDAGDVSNDISLIIGQDARLANQFFNGTIDEVRVWNRTLSAEEIKQQYLSNLNKYDIDRWNFFSNQTNLTDNTYTYQAYATDKAGNTNQTEERAVTIDTTNPIVTLISPANNSGDSDGNITLHYNVADTNNVTNCSLIINGKINITNSSITKEATQNFKLTNIAVGPYNWSINCSDSANNIGNSEKRFLSIALSNEFITTNLSNVNITNITNLIIEKEKVGKINFSDSIDLSDGADINYYINLSNNRIEINSTALPQLNKSATLYLFNLTFANPRILRDGEICPETICKEVSYTKAGGYGNLTFNVTRFTVYSADETPVAAEETAADSGTGGGGGGGGAGGGAGLPFPDICYSDSDCEEGYSCLNHKCVELFDMKVIGVDSPIQPGEFLDFTYLMKGMANISGDVIVNFWLEKDGKVATSGSDTIYLGPFEEKIETTSISLPLNIATGIYDFYVQINYGNYAAKAFRTVQVDYIVPDILEISLKDLPQINSEDIFEFYAILSYNKHTPIQLFLEERLKRGNKTVWEKERDLLLNRSITLTEKIGELKAGEYQLELIGSYNNKTSRLSQTFNVESTFKGNLFNHIILAAVISVFTIFFIFYKKLKGARELEAYRFQQYLTYISRKIGEKSTRKCISVLVNYLRKNRARGIEDIKLKRALIQAGWPEMLIEGVFKNPDLMRQKHATRPPDSIS